MEKLFKYFRKRNLIFAGVLAVIAFILSITASFTRVDNVLTDSIYQRESINPAQEIVILAIDNKTIEKYGAYESKTYRDLLTTAFNNLADKKCKPATIGFDMIFNENKNYDDTEFANALSRFDNVVLGVNGYNRKDAPYGLSNTLYQACDTVAAVDAVVDSDDTIRRISLRGSYYDSLNYTLYKNYCIANGIEAKEYSKGYYYFDYNARTDNTSYDAETGEYSTSESSIYQTFSLADIVEGKQIVPFQWKNKIVIVGSFASAVDSGLAEDKYNTPIGNMFGMEIQANAVQALLNDEIYTPVSNIALAFINFFVVFILVFVMASSKFWIAGIEYLVSFGIELGVMFIAHSTHHYYFISVPIFILFAAFVLLIADHYFLEYKHKKEVLGTFKRYISPDVADALVDKSTNAFELGGQKRNVACLFVDIRGFTKMSEELDPEKVVDILNGYLEMSTKQVFRFNGMVDKFIGDCVMAIFNAPVDLEDYIYKAVCAAYGIVHEGKKICDEVWEKYGKKLEFGVGVHYGDAVIGNIGSKTRMDYTAIGDTVNTASRIEASAGGNQVLISEDVLKALEGRIEVTFAGDRMFKNKKEPIKCFEVISIEGYKAPEEDKQ